MHKMGRVCAPHPCHNPSHNPRVHCQKTPFAQPNSRAATKEKHDTGGKRVVGDITHERKEGQQVHKMGQVCAPHQCQSSSHNPRMHCRKTPFAQPNSLAATKEECHRRETRGGETEPKRERKVSKCTRWGRYVHHTHATAPHTTHACIAEKRHLHNQTHGLRRRKNDTGGKHAAGRHNPREKGRSASAQDGAGMCTTPMPQLLTQPSHALPKNAICTTKLTCCDEGKA